MSHSDRAWDGGESGAMGDSATGCRIRGRAGNIGHGDCGHELCDCGLSGGDCGSAWYNLLVSRSC